MDEARSDLCGCCDPPVPAAPAVIYNRPALSAIAYRVGTFATFRAAMLDRLHDTLGLTGLTTRDSDDYGITILELWAAVADVLTFYQERIANEAYLRTALHRDSVLRLARLLDYRLRPGLAAEARLAFTIDPNQLPGRRNQARIPVGVKVMSVPGQDEQPQIFETIEEIVGDARLNALAALPVPAAINPFAQGTASAPLLARPDSLAVGDRALFFTATALEEKQIADLDLLDTPAGRHLRWQPAIQSAGWTAAAAHAVKRGRQLRFFGVNAADSFQYYDPGALNSDGVWAPPPSWREQALTLSFGDADSSYPLDARYEDLKPGMQLLLDSATGPDRLRRAAVVDVAQAQATLHPKYPQPETVTHVILTRVIRDAPTVLSRASNQVDVCARGGADCGLHLLWSNAGRERWEPLGGILASPISAAAWAADRLDIVARGADGALLHRWRSGGGQWQPGGDAWESLGGSLSSAPALVSWGPNRLDVFARGLDRALWHRAWNGSFWTAWQSLGGQLTSQPVAVARAANRLDAFARGTDGALWHRWWNGAAWGGWQSVGGQISDGLCAIARAADRLDVFARAADGSLQTIGWNGSTWSGWKTLAPAITGTPAVASWTASRLDVLTRAPDATLLHMAWNGSVWSAPTTLAGKTSSDPAVVSPAANRIDVFAAGVEGGLQHRDWNGSQWSGWDSVAHGLGRIDDRRRASLYQLEQEIVFRQFDYAPQLSGARITVPLAALDGIDENRAVLLQAPGHAPHLASVSGCEPLAAVTGGALDHLAIDLVDELPVGLPTGETQLLGNVARATHGQSIAPEEILGDGNSAVPFQRFTLRQAPVTYLASSRQPRGAATLSILINGERWTEVDSLYGQGPTARVYVLQQDDEQKTTVQFGDGRTGARLPSGRGNVRAQYRYGLGLAGRVEARQLSIALTRPIGLKDVTNPAAAEGGADPEPRDAARTTAPTSVRTFGRAVSLTDFEILVTASGEVAKASATWVWQALQKAVHLTVAAQRGAPLSRAALARLHAGLDQARDANHPLLLDNVCRAAVALSATLIVEADRVRADVLAAARRSLVGFFDFDNLALARSLHRSDIYAVLQGVPGVAAVDLDVFHFKGYAAWSGPELAVRGATANPLQPHLRIFSARAASGAVLSHDRIVRAFLAGAAPPAVLPAEQAFLEDPAADLLLGAIGGIG